MGMDNWMNNLPYDLLSQRETPALGEVVKELANVGWEFESDYWESGHNGDPYDDVKFKSPNMPEFVRIGEYDWPKITKQELLAKEAEAVAQSWVDNLLDSSFVLEKPFTELLTKYFIKRKDSCFGKFTTFDLKTKVLAKLSLKNKHQPKSVKITIEIT
jgi:hypothetical protein